MSIRPFFKALFVLTCVSVLLFAFLVPAHAPVVLQVHLDQPHPRA